MNNNLFNTSERKKYGFLKKNVVSWLGLRFLRVKDHSEYIYKLFRDWKAFYSLSNPRIGSTLPCQRTPVQVRGRLIGISDSRITGDSWLYLVLIGHLITRSDDRWGYPHLVPCTVVRKFVTTVINIYKTLVRRVLTYGSEVWVLFIMITDENRLFVFERTILRRVVGPFIEGCIGRMQSCQVESVWRHRRCLVRQAWKTPMSDSRDFERNINGRASWQPTNMCSRMCDEWIRGISSKPGHWRVAVIRLCQLAEAQSRNLLNLLLAAPCGWETCRHRLG